MPPVKTILALDPSGAFYEGSGTTGICCFDTKRMLPLWVETLQASTFTQMEEYWDAHCIFIEDLIRYYRLQASDMMIVIEDYLLYSTKVQTQINSRMETPKLIGVLQHFIWQHHWPYYMQAATNVVNRWNDSILLHKGYLTQKANKLYLAASQELTNEHNRDALRHAIHYATFKNKGEKNGKS